MKHFVLLFILLGCASLAKAQETALYECLYQYEVNGRDKKDQPFSEIYNGILQIGASQAKFQDYTAFQSDSVKQAQPDNAELQKEYDIQVLKNPNYFDQTVYQNLPQGKMTLLGVITPDYYVYAEDLNAISWTWTEDTDTVCGYPCRKATGTYGGRTWTAWYATDIPVSFGPWKLTGLPGLILEAYDSENIHRFSAISFRKAKSSIRPLEADNALTITRDKFVKAKNHFEQDPMKNLPIEAISGMEVRKFGEGVKDGSISINGVPLRLHPNGYVPLELQ